MSSTFYLESEEEADRRLALGQVKISGHGQHGNQGNRDGSEHKRLSPEVKTSVAVLAKLIGNKAAGELAGINPSTVGKYKNGKDSAGNIDPEHKERVDESVAGIEETASKALKLALEGLLDPARLAEAKARDLGSVANNLSAVIERIKGKNNLIIAGKVVVMAPPTEKLENYQVIDVEAREID